MKRREFTEEFRREAVRLVETSGLTLKQVSQDLGICLSTLTRWKQIYRDSELSPEPDAGLHKELSRLRRENDLLRKERDLLKRRQLSLPRRQIPSRRCKHRLPGSE